MWCSENRKSIIASDGILIFQTTVDPWGQDSRFSSAGHTLQPFSWSFVSFWVHCHRLGGGALEITGSYCTWSLSQFLKRAPPQRHFSDSFYRPRNQLISLVNLVLYKRPQSLNCFKIEFPEMMQMSSVLSNPGTTSHGGPWAFEMWLLQLMYLIFNFN